MIGQSGLPMMNNLAGSKEKAPEDAPAKSAARTAGAFEKAFLPDASVDGQPTPLEASSPTDARGGSGLVPPDQASAAQFGEQRLISPAGGATPTDPDFDQKIGQPIPDVSNNSQQSGASDLLHSTALEDVGSDPQISGVEAQASENEAKTPLHGILQNEAGQLTSPTSGALDPASLPEDHRSIEPGQVGRAPENSILTPAPDRPEVAANSAAPKAAKADLPVIGAEARPLQQVFHAPTASSPSPVSDSADIRQSVRTTDPNQALTKADAAGSLATTPPTEKTIESQVAPAQLRPTGSPPLGEFQSTATSAQPGLSSSPSNNTVSFPDTGELKLAVSASTQPVLSVASENSLLTLGPSGETGGATAITSTASSRYDAPATTLPTVDAKQVVHQINQAIIRMDGARTEILLDPVELGRVSLTFITKDEGVIVLITADRSETADLLRRNGEQLQRDLSGSGYEDVHLDFAEGGDTHQDQSGADRIDDAISLGATSVSYDGNLAPSGLDIRI